MMKTRDLILDIVYMSFYLALGLCLSYLNELFPIIKMPNGGSLEYAVIACFVASFHLGWKKGIVVSLFIWYIGTFFGLHYYFVSWPQVLLDYMIPYGCLGLASIFPKIKIKTFVLNNIYIGITGCMFIKYVSHVLAGAYFWFPEGEAAGSLAAWIYSGLTYNLGYNLITLIVALILTPKLIHSIRNITNFIGIKE